MLIRVIRRFENLNGKMYSFLKQVARSRAESMNQNEAVWTPKIDVATLAAAYFDFELSLAAEALYSYSLTVKFL